MSDIKGPTVDREAFEVVGHCCGIRLPVLDSLIETGLRFELTPEVEAHLKAAGVRPSHRETDAKPDSKPDPGIDA